MENFKPYGTYCLATPEPFYGVDNWHEDFNQTSDEEMCRLLQNDTVATNTLSINSQINLAGFANIFYKE